MSADKASTQRSISVHQITLVGGIITTITIHKPAITPSALNIANFMFEIKCFMFFNGLMRGEKTIIIQL